VKKRPSVLNEDSVKLYNQWVSGIAKRDLQPELITVADIVNRYRNKQEAPKSLPFPLNRALDALGDLFVKCADMRRVMADSLTYPVVKENENSVRAVRDLNEKIAEIQNIIVSCTEELNQIVEKSQK
jgi:hypothetical protein